MLKNYLLVFFISMVPIVELRGAIPVGLGLGLPALPVYFLCVLGNMIPVPFIYLFARACPGLAYTIFCQNIFIFIIYTVELI